MHLKIKISLLLFSSLALLFIVIAWNSINDFRNAAAHSAESQALSAAKVIEAGLNAHMINGSMDQRDEFIKQASSLETMKNLWIVRSQKVSQQYGKGPLAQDAHDGIDKSVLESGERVSIAKGGLFEDSTIRYSYPYKAISTKEIDCLSCHDVKVGDTLGVISLEMQTNDLKTLNFNNILVAILILITLFALMVYFLWTKIIIYFDRFDAMGKCVRAVEEGDFNARIPEELAHDYDAASLNRLIEKFQTSLEGIKGNLNSIIQVNEATDPLDALQLATYELHQVQLFTQTLQKDTNLDEVYTHIATHFGDQFNIDDINIIKYNALSQETDIVYEKKQIVCDAASGCLAARGNEVVDSSFSSGKCPKMITPDENYICFPCAITPNDTIVLSMVSDKKNGLYPVRANQHAVRVTLQGVKEHIAQHQMIEDLKRLERVDLISGLYNQRYLEERLFQISRETKRAVIPYGILVMNIDKFSAINDEYGKKVGDDTLAAIGRTLLDSLRESDLICRTHDDEFVVLLFDCNPLSVASVGEKIRSLFANKKLKSHPAGFILTMSVGSAIFPQQHKNIFECVKYARLAMQEAKREGGNLVTKFHSRLLEDK